MVKNGNYTITELPNQLIVTLPLTKRIDTSSPFGERKENLSEYELGFILSLIKTYYEENNNGQNMGK